MGVVYHSNFFVYFEIGRTDYLRSLGFTYKRMEEEDIFMPVTESYCQFKLPAYYDDELEVATSLEFHGRVRLKFHYEVTRPEDSRLIASGYTVHVPVTANSVPRRLPEKYRDAMVRATGETA